jgi:D-3-phosphoglycerate dehydrogenase / 2-oxoglutarate reductase
MQKKYTILITCPPMIGMMNEFADQIRSRGGKYHVPEFSQTVSEDRLVELIADFDGWIIGDDPVTRKVLKTGKDNHLKAAVKWGIGVDNIDLAAASELQIKIANTPDMFGHEVADIAICYLIGLARKTFRIDREVRTGKWPKYTGLSLYGKTAAVVGYGDIGRQIASRLGAMGMKIIVYDPVCNEHELKPGEVYAFWPAGLEHCNFIILSCSLNADNKNILNKNTLSSCRDGVFIINVSRGGLIDETALIEAMLNGKVDSVALDVMEKEPLPITSPLMSFDNCILGSHNASNTIEAVRRTSIKTIDTLFDFLEND